VPDVLFKFFRRPIEGNVCVSYPKSGRTWLRFALNLARAPVHYNHGGYATRDPAQLGYEFKGIRPAFFGEQTLFLHRNPIDTSVSEFYQIHNRIFNVSHPRFDEIRDRLMKANLVPPSTIDEFVLHPIWGCNKVSMFNRAHLTYFKKRQKCHIVTYESLRAEPAKMFSEILDFFGVKNYDISLIVEGSSFDRMRQVELNADPDARKKMALYGIRDNDENSLKVRKGLVKGYTDVLKPETIASARAICGRYGIDA